MNYKDWLKILAVILLLGIGFYRFKNQVHSASGTQIIMDTWVEIKFSTKQKNSHVILQNAFKMVTDYDLKFSYFNESSLLYNLNKSTNETHDMDPDFYEILLLSQKLYYETNHLYDVTIGALIDVWDFHTGEVPSNSDIDNGLNNIGFNNISFDQDILYKPPNIKLNFSSVCKGFIVDKVMEYLVSNNVLEASVNAGGDLKFYSVDKRKWRIGIQHPRSEGEIIEILNIPDFAVATTGDYERFFMVDQYRYHHILDPYTGFPSQENVSVTIISQNAMIADALSTSAFLMNPFNAMELIKSYPNTEGIIYFFDENNKLISIRTENIRKWM